jgi:hypothetical protein
VRKGPLGVMGEDEKKHFMFYFLFNDILVVTKAKVRTATFTTKRKSEVNTEETDLEKSGYIYKYQSTISLANASLLDVSSETEVEDQSFLLETPTHTYKLYADSYDGLMTWMNDIDDQIAQLVEKQISRIGVATGTVETKRKINSPSEIDIVNPAKQGILQKQSKSGGEWKRRFFAFKGSVLYYITLQSEKQTDKTAGNGSVIAVNHLCMVKRTISDRQFCFQFITPTRIIILAADSNKTLYEWIYVLRKEIAEHLKNTDKIKVKVKNNFSNL